MSGAKCTNASVTAARRAQARAEREERAREEAERRAAEERRLAQERCNRLREGAATQAASVLARLAALEHEPAGRFVASSAADELRGDVQRATEEARGASTETAARAAQRTVGEQAARFDRLANEARAAARAAEQVAAEADEADAELNRLLSGPAARYLPPGADSGWAASVSAARAAAGSATDAESVRRAATELSAARGEVRRAAAGAETAQQEAAEGAAEARRLTGEIDSFARGPLAAHAEPGRVTEIAGTVARAAGDLDRATDRAAVTDARRALAAARDEFRHAGEVAASNQRSAHLAAEGQALARLRAEFGALDSARSQKFDAPGYADVSARLTAAEQQLARGELEAVRQSVPAVRAALDAHTAEVGRRFRVWQTERDGATQAVTVARTAVRAVRDDARRARWVSPPLHDLDKRLGEADRQVTREEFVPARATATAVTQEAGRLGALGDELATESERVAELRGRASGAQPVPGLTFDPNGARDTARHLDAADAALKATKLGDAQQQTAAARDRLARHEGAARDAAERWQKERDEAAAALDAARDRLATLRADAVVGRWQRNALAEWDKQLAKATADLGAARGDPDADRPRFAAARRAADGLTAAEPKMLDEANRLQVQADLQAQISSGVAQVMQELGFSVVSGAENPDDPRSAIVLQATRDNGDLIDVAVEHEGRIEYAVGGRLEKTEEVRVVEGRDRVVKRCDQAEEQILRMHELLLQLGIETDGLKWDDQPPDDGGAEAENPVLTQMRRNQPRARSAGNK